ncbi:hypothetical protein GCM10022224_088220 [Nonomuraea antimicrobica]|uniref:Uncharacterized protein n=1 Tax=Nonomuraea antimicrobica TaxID=561173 RepID=A0ABP7DTU6_9ACTN
MDKEDPTFTAPDEASGPGAGSERLRLVHEAIDAWRACGRLPGAAHAGSSDDEEPR